MTCSRALSFALFPLLLMTATGASAHVLRLKIARSSAPVIEDEGTGGAIDAGNSWLGSEGIVTEAAVDRLVQILQQDPQGAELVAKATQHAEETVHQPFWKVISVCPAGTDSNILGQTNRGTPLIFREERDIEETVADVLPDGTTDASVANAYYRAKIDQDRTEDGIPSDAPYTVRYFPDVFMVKAMNHAPGICLQANLSVDEAVSTLYHEMVHYNAADWSRWVQIGKYAGEGDYELKQVLSTGDEVDAYISQWSYQIRKGGRQTLPYLLQPFFSDAGAFIPTDAQGRDNRQAVAQLVLGGQIFAGGEGYHQLRFVSEYANELNYEDQSQTSLYNFLLEIAQNRQANLAYYQQKSDADYQEDERSIQRLPQEEASCKARVDSLNALVAQFNLSQQTRPN